VLAQLLEVHIVPGADGLKDSGHLTLSPTRRHLLSEVRLFLGVLLARSVRGRRNVYSYYLM
jgi:hypothetical protein